MLYESNSTSNRQELAGDHFTVPAVSKLVLVAISAALYRVRPSFLPGKERRLTFPSQRLVTEPKLVPSQGSKLGIKISRIYPQDILLG